MKTRIVCLDCYFIWQAKSLYKTYRCPECGGTDMGEITAPYLGHKKGGRS